MKKHKIARLVVGKSNGQTLLRRFISKSKGVHYEFVITPGGFLFFSFPEDLQEDISVDSISEKQS